MISGTSHSMARATLPRLDTVQIHFDWPQVFQTHATNSSYDTADMGGNPADELAILLGATAQEPYERMVQALRDVRHLLPPEGVAIVDAALR